MNDTNISFSDLNSKLEGASNLSISTLGKSMERVGLETTTSPSTSHLQGALGPLVGSQKAGDSVQVEVMDQSLGDLAVKTSAESAMEAFMAHVLAQESVDERVSWQKQRVLW